ncbi:MAG: PASTA domain-containing protein [Tannerella sp.]|jgi:beta-lactam-binding protein with PASTA domain|nr:PASTA domain-containing protein [Tannerella sp.]
MAINSAIDKILKLPVYVHILVVGALCFILIGIVLKGIDSYTNHNQAVLVPDVKGLQLEDAAPFFEKNFLHYTVIDSIYSKDVMPGAIVELSPEVNSKVKKNRIVYVTINAKTEEMAAIPEVTDVSFRQAYALLKSTGFFDVELKYVSGEFRDLAIGVEYGGKIVNTGTRVPMTAKLVLVLGDGNLYKENVDSISKKEPVIIDGDESWF